MHLTYQTFNVVLKYHLCMSNVVSTVEVICAVAVIINSTEHCALKLQHLQGRRVFIPLLLKFLLILFHLFLNVRLQEQDVLVPKVLPLHLYQMKKMPRY